MSYQMFPGFRNAADTEDLLTPDDLVYVDGYDILSLGRGENVPSSEDEANGVRGIYFSPRELELWSVSSAPDGKRQGSPEPLYASEAEAQRVADEQNIELESLAIKHGRPVNFQAEPTSQDVNGATYYLVRATLRSPAEKQSTQRVH